MTQDACVIRPAEFKDAEAVFRLIKSFPEELIPRPISDIVQNIDRCIVAEIDDEVVGTLSWHVLPEIGSASEQHVVEIKSVAVGTEHRRKGIGKALVEAGIERTRPLHMSQIIVLTFTPDFFESLGFKEIPKEQLMHKIYMGCINCTKYDSPFTCPEIAMALDVSAG